MSLILSQTIQCSNWYRRIEILYIIKQQVKILENYFFLLSQNKEHKTNITPDEDLVQVEMLVIYIQSECCHLLPLLLFTLLHKENCLSSVKSRIYCVCRTGIQRSTDMLLTQNVTHMSTRTVYNNLHLTPVNLFQDLLGTSQLAPTNQIQINWHHSG